MLNKMFVKILFIVCIVNVTLYSGVKEAFKHLQQNREVINNALLQCPDAVLKFPLCGPFMDGFKTSLASQSAIDDQIMARIVSDYLSDINGMTYLLSGKKTDIVSDDISVIFLAKLISDENDKRFTATAAKTLRNRVSYVSLKKHKNLLDTVLSKSCSDVGIRQKNEIRILTGGLNEKEKQALIASNGVSLPYLARLGDTSAIKQLRVQYHNSKDFHGKDKAIDDIFDSGQMNLIKMVVSDFNDPTYNIYTYKNAPPCTSQSTRYIILQGVRRSYPYEKLLNEDLIELLYLRDKNMSLEHNRRYNELVTKWLEKQYGVKINDNPEAFIIKNFFWLRELVSHNLVRAITRYLRFCKKYRRGLSC